MRMRYPTLLTFPGRLIVAGLALLLSGCFQVQLNGPVGGATVTLAEWWTPEDILQTTVSKDETALIAEHGAEKWAGMGPKLKLMYLGAATFDTSVIDDETIYLVTATGGVDYDWDRDGVPDDSPTPVAGKLRAILPGSALKGELTRVNLITEAMHATVSTRYCPGCRDGAVITSLLNATSERVVSDISRDGEVTLKDALRWNSARHRTAYWGDQQTLDELAEAVRSGQAIEQDWIAERFLKDAKLISDLWEQYPHLAQCSILSGDALLYTHEVREVQCYGPDPYESNPSAPSLTGIERYSSLRRVQLGTPEYYGKLEPLTRSPRLETVDTIFFIDGPAYAPSLEDMAVLARIPGLKSLGLSRARFATHDWLRQMTSLEVLAWRLSTDNFDAVMDELRHLPEIKEIDPDIAALSTQQLQRLQELERLKYLQIVVESDPVDLNKLPALPNLEELTILGWGAPTLAELPNGIGRVADFPRLKYLRVQETDLSDLSPIMGLVELETVSTFYNQITAIPDLSRLKSLRRLEIYDYSEFPITDASGLAGLTALESLFISSARLNTLDAFSTLENMRSLRLQGAGLVSLDGVQNMPGLRELDISGNPITDFSPLLGLTALKELDAIEMDLTEVNGLAGHPSLRSLDLSWNAIRSTSSLGELPTLQTLNLRENALISLEGLDTLNSARRIDVSKNRDLQCDEVERIRALLPDAYIVANGINCPN